MTWDIATISVITSATVAVLSLILPLLVNSINERSKWKREAKAAELEKIEKATIELLESLAPFGTNDVREATGQYFAAVYSQVLTKYYAWERTVWAKFKGSELDELVKIRKQIQENKQDLYKHQPALAAQILAYANLASKRV